MHLLIEVDTIILMSSTLSGTRMRISFHSPHPTASFLYTKIWYRKITFPFSTNPYSQRRLFMTLVQKRPMKPTRQKLTGRQNSQIPEDDEGAPLILLMRFLAQFSTNTRMILSPMTTVLVITKGSMAMGNDLMDIWILLTDWGIREELQAKHGGRLCTNHSNREALRGEEIGDIYVGFIYLYLFGECSDFLQA